MTLYHYPRLIDLHLRMARSMVVWTLAIGGTAAVAALAFFWGRRLLPPPVATGAAVSALVGAALQAVVCCAVKPWRRVPTAVGVDEWGVHLYGGRAAYRHIAWGRIEVAKEEAPPLWLAPYCAFGVLSVTRVGFAGSRPDHFYILANMADYDVLISALRPRVAATAAIKTYGMGTYAKSLYVAGLPLIALAVWVFISHRNEAPPWFVPGYLGFMATLAAVGLWRNGYAFSLGPGWTEVRGAFSRRRFPDRDLVSLRVWPTMGGAVVRWRTGSAYVSAGMIEGYGELLAEIRRRIAERQMTLPSRNATRQE